jgi:hypothetical protein
MMHFQSLLNHCESVLGQRGRKCPPSYPRGARSRGGPLPYRPGCRSHSSRPPARICHPSLVHAKSSLARMIYPPFSSGHGSRLTPHHRLPFLSSGHRARTTDSNFLQAVAWVVSIRSRARHCAQRAEPDEERGARTRIDAGGVAVVLVAAYVDVIAGC